MKNANLNLAAPLLNLYEPASVPVKSVMGGAIKVNVWDSWEVRHEKGDKISLQDVLDYLHKVYHGIFARDVSYGATPIYQETYYELPQNKKNKLVILKRAFIDTLEELVDFDVINLTLSIYKLFQHYIL